MRKALIIIFLSLVLIFLYGKYIEVNNFKVKEYSINAPDIPSTFADLKIIQFSDILYEGEKVEKKLTKIIDKINAYDADIVIFSGDLFNQDYKYSEKDYTFLKESFKNIKANLYKYAVIGDNDQKFLKEYKDILYEGEFILLDNEQRLLFYKDEEPINIIGITDNSAFDHFDSLINTEVPVNYTLAITHKPDNFNSLKNYDIDTVLAGHSLGGIINIPYVGGLINKKGSTTYKNNYYKENNKELFISNGIGYEDYNFRLLNIPSINVYRFVK